MAKMTLKVVEKLELTNDEMEMFDKTLASVREVIEQYEDECVEVDSEIVDTANQLENLLEQYLTYTNGVSHNIL